MRVQLPGVDHLAAITSVRAKVTEVNQQCLRWGCEHQLSAGFAGVALDTLTKSRPAVGADRVHRTVVRPAPLASTLIAVELMNLGTAPAPGFEIVFVRRR
jgi:hypothetical protein